MNAKDAKIAKRRQEEEPEEKTGRKGRCPLPGLRPDLPLRGEELGGSEGTELWGKAAAATRCLMSHTCGRMPVCRGCVRRAGIAGRGSGLRGVRNVVRRRMMWSTRRGMSRGLAWGRVEVG